MNRKLHIILVFFISVLAFQTIYAQDWEIVGTEGLSSEAVSRPRLAIDSNDNVYVIYSDGIGTRTLTVEKFDGTTWEIIGNNEITQSQGGFVNIVIDSNDVPYISYSDFDNSSIVVVKKLVNDIWVDVGNMSSFTQQSGQNRLAINSLNEPHVFFNTPNQFGDSYGSLYKFDGTNWVSLTFSGITNGPTGNSSFFNPNIEFNQLDEIHVSYSELGLNPLGGFMKKLNVNNWETLGGDVYYENFPTGNQLIFDNNDVPYVVFVPTDDFLSKIRKLENGVWVSVGTGVFSQSGSFNPSIVFDANNDLYVSCTESLYDYRLTVFKFNGSDFIPIGSPGFTSGSADHSHLKIDSNQTLYVSYDNENSKVTVQKFDLNTLSSSEFDTNEISVYPNPVEDKLSINLNDNDDFSLKLFDMFGRKVLEISNSKLLDFSDYSSGIYHLVINSSNKIYSKKIVKH